MVTASKVAILLCLRSCTVCLVTIFSMHTAVAKGSAYCLVDRFCKLIQCSHKICMLQQPSVCISALSGGRSHQVLHDGLHSIVNASEIATLQQCTIWP